MTTQEAINQLNKMAVTDRDYEAVNMVTDSIMHGGWISVKDRLPDVNDNYIVTACDEDCPYGEGIWYDTVVVVAEYYKGSWTWCDNGLEYDLNGLITHWMPLPQPPKEE